MLKCLFLCALLVGLSTQEVEQERESSRKTTVRNYIEEENKIESSTKQSSRNFVVRKNTHGMYVLNERNFDSFIKESITKTLRRGIFVKFYAPWCGHCKELEKPWEALTRAVELYQDSLNNGDRKIDIWYQSNEHKYIYFDKNVNYFDNINTVEQLNEYNK